MEKDKEILAVKAEEMETTPEEQEEFASSYAVVKRLLPFLAKRGIPVSPKNYRIFYDYLLHINPVLNKTVNGLLENNAKFHSQLSNSLYEHFYSNEAMEAHAKVINKAAMDFIAVSSSMEQSLSKAMTHTSRYKQVLNDSSRQMAAISSPDQMQSFLRDLMKETDAALAQNDNFSSRLGEANHIIAELKEELKNQTALARVDELTKLYNRRHLEAEAPRMMERSRETGLPLSAIMFDLDNFKNVNDTWGHTYGDKVLVICADIIKKTSRTSDMPVRFGGEEFLLLCTGLDLMAAARVAERIRLAIEGTEFTVRGNPLSVTISAGVAQYSAGDSLTALIDRADTALYKAKCEGRNQVCMTPIESGL